MVPYHPQGDETAWAAAYEKYLKVTNQ